MKDRWAHIVANHTAWHIKHKQSDAEEGEPHNSKRDTVEVSFRA